VVDVGDEAGQVGGFAGELLLAVGVADEGGRENDFDGNGLLLKAVVCCLLFVVCWSADLPTSDDETV
jgi:hypothetical protein